MHAALKKIIVPELRRLGFKGTYPHFRRFGSNHTDLLGFQFDKYGDDLFIAEIAQAPGTGFYISKWGEEYQREKLKYYQVTEARYRLQPRLGGGGESWFSYASEEYDEVARSLFPHLERAEKYFANTSHTEGLQSLSTPPPVYGSMNQEQPGR
ncbi:MAG: DUF4304 domain-containing protein [Cyanobacteria bacterium SZAS LIN-2]|nr:DUF4304 domain-containing protein [Cyanobacteria bacterium SZAS LIN-3]MBS1996486.1 DUF4304 domain-containing protein [Cyanobacteria bacterium SZAS LIN-2]